MDNKLLNDNFFAICDAAEEVFDEFDEAEEQFWMTQVMALEFLKAQIHGATKEEVDDILKAHEGFEGIWDGDVEKLEKTIDANIAKATESMTDEIFGDGLVRALVGARQAKIDHLLKTIPECKQRLLSIKDSTVAGRVQSSPWARVKSRFLLNYQEFQPTVKGFTKMCHMLAGLKSANDVDPNALISCLAGTPYFKAIQAAPKNFLAREVKTTDWMHTVTKGLSSSFSPINLLGLVATGGWLGIANLVYRNFLHNPEAPIGQRGWETKEKLIEGCDKTLELVKAAQKAVTNCQKILLDKTADKSKRKFVAAMSKFCVHTAGEMGRGIVFACRKVAAGFLGRLLWWNRIS